MSRYYKPETRKCSTGAEFKKLHMKVDLTYLFEPLFQYFVFPLQGLVVGAKNAQSCLCTLQVKISGLTTITTQVQQLFFECVLSLKTIVC